MKTKHLKAAGAAVSLLIASSPALATPTFPETLGPPVTALDAFTFSCPTKPLTVYARARVHDTAPPFAGGIFNPQARMRVVLTKLASVPPFAPQVEDMVPAGTAGEAPDLLSPSTWAIVVGGSGFYRAMFLKTADGPESYWGDIECILAGGVIFNPFLPPVPQQNQ